jgi:DNA-binding transcriptional LysR family regulator
MNIRFLETFVWVARLKSFRLTAEKLCTTQASISSRIAALEDELDSRLFVRDPRGVTLTPEGQRVLDYAERMVDTLHELKAALKDPGMARGHLRIGTMDTVIHTWFSALVQRIGAAWPAVEVDITADTARNLCDQLEKGYQDIILQTDMVRLDTVRNAVLDRYPMQWVVATGSAQDRPYPDLRTLAAERIVTFSRNSRPHQDLLNLLHGADLATTRVNCVNSASAIIRLIQEGFGIGLLPLPLVKAQVGTGSLRLVEGLATPPPMDIVASWRTGPGMALSEQVVALAQGLIAQAKG